MLGKWVHALWWEIQTQIIIFAVFIESFKSTGNCCVIGVNEGRKMPLIRGEEHGGSWCWEPGDAVDSHLNDKCSAASIVQSHGNKNVGNAAKRFREAAVLKSPSPEAVRSVHQRQQMEPREDQTGLVMRTKSSLVQCKNTSSWDKLQNEVHQSELVTPREYLPELKSFSFCCRPQSRALQILD